MFIKGSIMNIRSLCLLINTVFLFNPAVLLPIAAPCTEKTNKSPVSNEKNTQEIQELIKGICEKMMVAAESGESLGKPLTTEIEILLSELIILKELVEQLERENQLLRVSLSVAKKDSFIKATDILASIMIIGMSAPMIAILWKHAYTEIMKK